MIHIVILAVCSLRLDFETFTTQGLSASTELAAITCQDTFIISVSYPVISLRKLTHYINTFDLIKKSTL